MVSTASLFPNQDRETSPMKSLPQRIDQSNASRRTINSFRNCYPTVSSVILILVSVLSTCIEATSGIIQEYQPITIVHTDSLLSKSFHGNHSHVDYFRLLQRDGDSLLIGARNFVYNISIHDLTEDVDRRIQWVSKQRDSDVCFSKGKSEDECHNYIRVLAKKDEGQFLVCGTNAYKPTCRDYSLQSNGSFSSIESTGVGKCPFDPRHNSTFVYVNGELYSGTVVDFQSNIPLVFRDPLKTDHNDYKQLNAPDFVHSFEYGDYVFFFLREIAVEYMNCGKKVFSRVARVCKDDNGVPQKRSTTQSTWTSFLKSRLNCSFPGQYPFYFDEIQSVSDVVLGRYGSSQNELIYAIFTTPENSIPGSAVCAFSMRDILDTFEGPFKAQGDLNSNWLPVPQHEVPDPRPGSCVNDSQSLQPEIINFVRAHPLMDELVPPFHGEPVFMRASFKFRFTKITVDPQVPLLTGGFVDVLFIATDDGKIMKIINSPFYENERQVAPIIIEEIHVFNSPVSINNLQIANQESGENKLIIITDVEVKAIPLQRCSSAPTCGECIALQDPYCGWFPNFAKCGDVSTKSHDIVLQNVSSGFHHHCPHNRENNLFPNPSTQLYTTGPVIGAATMDGPLIYSAETLAIAVTTACVAAIVVGFISGFLFSRKCRGDDYPHFSETPYLDSKLNKCENTADPNMYTANNASLPIKQLNNLVTNYKNTNNGKSNNTDNKLIKPAKCAYI